MIWEKGDRVKLSRILGEGRGEEGVISKVEDGVGEITLEGNRKLNVELVLCDKLGSPISDYAPWTKEYADSIYTAEDPWNVRDAKDGTYDFILKMLKPYLPADLILDIGSGLGAFTNRFSKVCKRVIGYDISDVAVKRAKVRFPNLEFHCVDFGLHGALGFVPEKADIVVASEVIYYLDFVKKLIFIENVYKATKNLAFFSYRLLADAEDVFIPWINLFFEPKVYFESGHVFFLGKKRHFKEKMNVI